MFQRKFIENSIYSKDISTWIEMVFGRKQQSEKQLNVYFEVCDYQYFNKIDKTQEFSRMKLKAIAEFQQIPIKLFEKKHPKAFTKNFDKQVNMFNSKSDLDINDFYLSCITSRTKVLTYIVLPDQKFIYALVK